jgi:hypothetical protein
VDLNGYIVKRVRGVLGEDGLILPMEGNREIGYLTELDIKKILAEAATEAGIPEGFPADYIILVRNLHI